MALGDIKKKLYKNTYQGRAHEKTVYNPHVARARDNALGDESPWRIKERSGLERAWRAPLLRIAIVFSVIILLIFAAWTFITVRSGLFHADKVTITITGPRVVSSGMTARYTLHYENNNAVTLKNAVLTVEHTPFLRVDTDTRLQRARDNTETVALGDIAPHKKGDITVAGHFAGDMVGTMYIKAVLAFTPSTERKPVVRQERLALTRDSKRLQLTVDAQKSVVSGNVIEYTVRYRNDSAQTDRDVVLLAQFPKGFTLHTVAPDTLRREASRDAWMLHDIAPGAEGTVTFRGTLEGLVDDVKSATFTLERKEGERNRVLAREEWATRIADTPLRVTQRVNGAKTIIAHAGEELTYTIFYENTSDLGMRDVVVRMKFDDDILNYRQLRLPDGGSLEPATRSVVWRAADVPALSLLSPGQKGQITLTIPVVDSVSVRDDRDRNKLVTTVVEIDSPDIPTPIGENKIVASNTLSIKLLSPTTLTTEGFYDDFTIRNTGPVPPMVGVKTTFTIRWSLTNGTNKLTNARVEAFLPTSVHWEGVTFPESETIQFNPRTHKIVWQLGDVDNGVGYFRKKREVRFQVSITPTINQSGRPASLLKESVFSATDTFTGTTIKQTTPEKTTVLSEDPSVKDGVVRN